MIDQKLTRSKIVQGFLDMFESPLWAAVMAAVVYAIFALYKGPLWSETSTNYFSYLADAFLHGQLYLRLMPPNTHDLVYFQNHYYLYWPPLPAILLMPLVALFGVHVSDVLVVLVIGATNVAIVAQVLRKADERGIVSLDKNRRALIVLFFAFGSVLFPLAPLGGVWAMGQFVGFLFGGLAYLAVLTFRGWKAFFFTGLALGLAFLARNHIFLIGIWPAYYLLTTHWNGGFKKIIFWALLALIPVIFAEGCYLTYNYVRFGNPMQLGLDYHEMAPLFLSDYKKYGAFNLHYLPVNFYYQYIYYPFPWQSDSFMGGSLFLLSPILFTTFAGIANGKPRVSVLFLCIAILMTSVPILLLMGTGWVQFGPRYTLDFTMPLILLVGIGIKKWRLSTIALLVGISCIHYLAGTIIMLQ